MNTKVIAVAIAVAVMLSACGGGGSSVSSSITEETVTPPTIKADEVTLSASYPPIPQIPEE